MDPTIVRNEFHLKCLKIFICRYGKYITSAHVITTNAWTSCFWSWIKESCFQYKHHWWKRGCFSYWYSFIFFILWNYQNNKFQFYIFWKCFSFILIISGADVIDTLPSLHPLVCLHNNIRQKAMDEFLENMMEIPTLDTSDVTNSVMTNPKNTIRSLSERLSQSHIPV